MRSLFSAHVAHDAFKIIELLLKRQSKKGYLPKGDRDNLKDALQYVKGFLEQEAATSPVLIPDLRLPIQK